MRHWLVLLLLLFSAPPASAGGNPTLPQPPHAGDLDMPLPAHVHWYEPADPLGLEVFTRETLPWIAPDAIGFRYTGPLRAPLAEKLAQYLLTEPQRYTHVLIELDSDGGELGYVEKIVGVLREARGRMEITTRVMEGSLCASGCIPVFMQGQIRKASGASIWVFHGARGAFTNLPDPTATDEYLDLLSGSGMTAHFRGALVTGSRIYLPGSLILSGHELFAGQDAGIITVLLPSWRPEEPLYPSGIGPR